jgi:short-subunit dehydrogenase
MPFLISADDAAEAITKGLRSNRFEIVFPWRMALAMKALRMLPNRMLFAITRRMVDDGE